MEQRIKDYEDFIKKKMNSPTDDLIAYHDKMIANFQHERFIHLIIMLFFVGLTFVLTMIVIFAMVLVKMDYWMSFFPMMLATLIMWILSIFYVKHYYFLENHIQGLYDVSKKLYENKAKAAAPNNDFVIDLKSVGQKLKKQVEKVLTKKEK
ncbi:hypothetical protein IKE84_01175 [Candidatus Saccharibacteria bacterium]|nr:hypothetical protein [Candidatus Saccharibacteria bacterium]